MSKRFAVAAPLFFLIASLPLNGCGLVDDWLHTTAVVRPAYVHAPPQVEAGVPFLIYADYDAGCGIEDALTVAADEEAKTLHVQVTQRVNTKQLCPASVSMKRLSEAVTLQTPGRYILTAVRRVAPTGGHSDELSLEVLPEGQPVSPWTPPPIPPY